MPKTTVAVGAALIASTLSCCVGSGFEALRREASSHETATFMAKLDRRPPPEAPVYVAPGKGVYQALSIVCFGAGALVFLAGAGGLALRALTAPSPPQVEGVVLFRRTPALECFFLVPLLMAVPVALGGVASSNLGLVIIGGAGVVILVPILLVLHAGTACVVDPEGITLGFGRRFRWSDFEGIDHQRVVQRTDSGTTRVVGGYYALKFKNGTVSLSPSRYSNWDACWQVLEPHTRRVA